MNLRSLLGAVEPSCGMSWQVEMFVFHVGVGCSLSSFCRPAIPSFSDHEHSMTTVLHLRDESDVGPYDDDGDGDGWALLLSGQSFPLLLP